jgi:hypothetical protein
METDVLSIEDELFLFETFLRISSPDYNDEATVFFSEDESDVSLDVPLSDFFMNDYGKRGCNFWVRVGIALRNLLHFLS